MTDFEFSQEVADSLLRMDKYCIDDETHSFPIGGGFLSIPLKSADRREDFLLDIRRARIDLLKGTYQNRARRTLILARLDFGGAPHRNPDGEIINCPHLHVYSEKYGTKFAIPAPLEHFKSPDRFQMLEDFMKYCNIVKPPFFERELFS